jgi:hypothetical protein
MRKDGKGQYVLEKKIFPAKKKASTALSSPTRKASAAEGLLSRYQRVAACASAMAHGSMFTCFQPRSRQEPLASGGNFNACLRMDSREKEYSRPSSFWNIIRRSIPRMIT